MSKCRNILFVLSLSFVSTCLAHDFVVPGSRGAAMSGSIIANSEDGHAVWYNPALLAMSNEFKFGFEYAGMYSGLTNDVVNFGSLGQIPSFQIMDGGDSPLLQKTRLNVDNVFSDNSVPESLYGFNLEFLLPIHRMLDKFPQRISFGGSIFVPGSGASIVAVDGSSPDQPFFPVFGSRIQRLKFMMGLGIEILDDLLSIGASVSVLTDITGSVGSLTPMTTFDPAQPEGKQAQANPSKATFKQDLGTSVTPLFGLLVKPVDGVNIGAYYRFPQSMDLKFNVDAGVDVNMGYTLVAKIPYYLKGDFFYVPASTGLGVGVSLIPSLLLTAQVDYVFWSELSDRINISDFDVEAGVINDNGALAPLEDYGSFKVRSYPVPPIHTRDTICPKAGLEWTLKGGFTKLRLGYAYTPSALKEDQGYENLLMDNTYHSISGGVGFALNDPLAYLTKPVLLDVHVLVDVLEPRVNKVGLSDPVAGYHAKGQVESSGYFLGFGVELTLQL